LAASAACAASAIAAVSEADSMLLMSFSVAPAPESPMRRTILPIAPQHRLRLVERRLVAADENHQLLALRLRERARHRRIQVEHAPRPRQRMRASRAIAGVLVLESRMIVPFAAAPIDAASFPASLRACATSSETIEQTNSAPCAAAAGESQTSMPLSRKVSFRLVAIENLQLVSRRVQVHRHARAHRAQSYECHRAHRRSFARVGLA
jgi:hypothetical protein